MLRSYILTRREKLGPRATFQQQGRSRSSHRGPLALRGSQVNHGGVGPLSGRWRLKTKKVLVNDSAERPDARGLPVLWKQLARLLRSGDMEYRCVATSVSGFVQQLVSCYLPHGYWFYVSGVLPPSKDPQAIDQKLMAKYGIGVSRHVAGEAESRGHCQRALHPVRAEVPALSNTRLPSVLRRRGPEHSRCPENPHQVRRILHFGSPRRFSEKAKRSGPGRQGYEVARSHEFKFSGSCTAAAACRSGLASRHIAVHRSVSQLARELADLPFEPYAPIRQQLLNVVRRVNQRRRASSMELLTFSVLRYRRRIVRPFGTQELSPATVRRIVRVAGE